MRSTWSYEEYAAIGTMLDATYQLGEFGCCARGVR
ncbi:Uncharacterised protein [Mycobacteroides abscessus subsp. massiliense]|nr:Uncharacterised protein [Mycobacteroides abscessus subsp. massiliense]